MKIVNSCLLSHRPPPQRPVWATSWSVKPRESSRTVNPRWLHARIPECLCLSIPFVHSSFIGRGFSKCQRWIVSRWSLHPFRSNKTFTIQTYCLTKLNHPWDSFSLRIDCSGPESGSEVIDSLFLLDARVFEWAEACAVTLTPVYYAFCPGTYFLFSGFNQTPRLGILILLSPLIRASIHPEYRYPRRSILCDQDSSFQFLFFLFLF